MTVDSPAMPAANLSAADVIEPTPHGTAPAAPVATPTNAVAEAMSALGNLGYGPSDAARAVAEAQTDQPDADTPALIRAALRLLAPKG
jgi:Holliday junction DNA helicase RuvA